MPPRKPAVTDEACLRVEGVLEERLTDVKPMVPVPFLSPHLTVVPQQCYRALNFNEFGKIFDSSTPLQRIRLWVDVLRDDCSVKLFGRAGSKVAITSSSISFPSQREISSSMKIDDNDIDWVASALAHHSALAKWTATVGPSTRPGPIQPYPMGPPPPPTQPSTPSQSSQPFPMGPSPQPSQPSTLRMGPASPPLRGPKPPPSRPFFMATHHHPMFFKSRGHVATPAPPAKRSKTEDLSVRLQNMVRR